MTTKQKNTLWRLKMPSTLLKKSSTTATPSFFSAAGQKAAVKRVVDTFTFNYDTMSVKNPLTGNTIVQNVAPVVKAVTAASYVGSAAFAGATIAGAVGSSTATGAAATATASNLFSKNSLVAAGAGLVAGSLLTKGGSASNAPQSSAADQTTQPTQSPQQKPQIFPSQEGDINPYIRQSGKGNQLTFNANRYQETPVFLSQPSTQSANPYLSTSQSQEALETGTNWALIAAIGLGAYVLLGSR